MLLRHCAWSTRIPTMPLKHRSSRQLLAVKGPRRRQRLQQPVARQARSVCSRQGYAGGRMHGWMGEFEVARVRTDGIVQSLRHSLVPSTGILRPTMSRMPRFCTQATERPRVSARARSGAPMGARTCAHRSVETDKQTEDARMTPACEWGESGAPWSGGVQRARARETERPC